MNITIISVGKLKRKILKISCRRIRKATKVDTVS